jgi:putative addiction module CopG family antidote
MAVSQKTLKVAITSKMEAFLNAKVAAGEFRSPGDVIRAAIRLLQQSEQTQALSLASIRAKLASGLAQAERGELKDGEAVFDSLERGLDELAGGVQPKRPGRKTRAA